MKLWLIKAIHPQGYDVLEAAVIRARSPQHAWAILIQMRGHHELDAYTVEQLRVSGEPGIIIEDVPEG